MRKVKILWADDEIQMLKPHILFLEEKGYEVVTTNSGDVALDLIADDYFDLVFLDENMPGVSGLEALASIKKSHPHVPVVMITKSEEEFIMEEAIGQKIADYLIKPVHPHQLLLTVKKNIDEKKLVSAKTSSDYQREFRDIGMKLTQDLDDEEWKDIYKEITYHELAIDKSEGSGMEEVLQMQKTEANNEFFKFIANNYESWIQDDEGPLLSHNVMEERVFPLIEKGRPVFYILMDCLRYDQWKVIEKKVSELYKVEEDIMFSILPTATQFCRISIFSGLLPADIKKEHKDKWVDENEEEGKNLHEEFFLNELIKRSSKDISLSYHKVTNLASGKKLESSVNNLFENDLNVVVYNFVDALSHARTDFKIVRELADDSAAYRDITASWFEHSPLWEMMKKIAKKGGKIVINTDHGSVQVKKPLKVQGEKEVSTNLRYKQGRNLRYKSKEVFEINNPDDVGLPRLNVSSKYIFAGSTDFFAYPNNFNYYVKHYKNTFQHGGVSMEEMMVPLIVLDPK
jgi:DNA-binding response OmpR family regulator